MARGRKGSVGGDDKGKSPARPGLPAASSILAEKMFTSPKKKRYRIIKTSERDATDEPAPAPSKKPT